ncbi:hypothetical protein Esti_006452 [Eimeria stiedai]
MLPGLKPHGWGPWRGPLVRCLRRGPSRGPSAHGAPHPAAPSMRVDSNNHARRQQQQQQQWCVLQQQRGYTPPSRRTWSKQNEKICTRRPLVEAFAMHKVQPTKQWWKEQPHTPETFLGLPDPLLHALRGGSLYIEQLDLVAAACVAARLLAHQQQSPSLWVPLARRAAALAARGPHTSLAFVFKALAAADVREAQAVCCSRLTDLALTHVELLLQHRDDFEATDLALSLKALTNLGAAEPQLLACLAGRLAGCGAVGLGTSEILDSIEALCIAYPVLNTCMQASDLDPLIQSSTSSSTSSSNAGKRQLAAHLAASSPNAYSLPPPLATPYNRPISYKPHLQEQQQQRQQQQMQQVQDFNVEGLPRSQVFAWWIPVLLNALLHTQPQASAFTAAAAAAALRELAVEAQRGLPASPPAAAAPAAAAAAAGSSSPPREGDSESGKGVVAAAAAAAAAAERRAAIVAAATAAAAAAARSCLPLQARSRYELLLLLLLMPSSWLGCGCSSVASIQRLESERPLAGGGEERLPPSAFPLPWLRQAASVATVAATATTAAAAVRGPLVTAIGGVVPVRREKKTAAQTSHMAGELRAYIHGTLRAAPLVVSSPEGMFFPYYLPHLHSFFLPCQVARGNSADSAAAAAAALHVLVRLGGPSTLETQQQQQLHPKED